MKTLVRIQHQSDSRLNLNFKTAQILIKPYKDSETIDVIGHISFQQNQGESKWYALNFNVSTSNPDHLLKMARLAKYIKENTDWDSQPDEIFEVIGAVKYKVFEHQFVPVSKNGENLYNFLTATGSLYTRIIAPDEKKAQKILDKKKLDGMELKFKSKVALT